MEKRVLISVSDKTGIENFAKNLEDLKFTIISTGGTKKVLEKAGIKVIGIEEVTGFPEMLDGRVKTLHPKIHGGLLGVRDNAEHILHLKKYEIDFIDIVVVNLYPFLKTTLKPNVTHAEIIENIDIGGPSMIRSAAKNYQSVTVVCDPIDYEKVIEELQKNKNTSIKTREELATKAFQLTAFYDAHIANYMNSKIGLEMPEKLVLPFEKHSTEIRYGENPHQKAGFYYDLDSSLSLSSAKQLQGKQLSYNNIQDANAAIQIVAEFNEPVVVGLKHMNPCGVGTGKSIDEAWKNCHDGDPISIFGGIVATNREINENSALEMTKIFLEIIIAPSFSREALKVFASKKNLRVLELKLDKNRLSIWQHVSVNGGILRQEWDAKNVDDCELKTVSKREPSQNEIEDLKMAQKIVKYVKSNAIVIVKNRQLIGVGAGQMNRIGAAKIALEACKEKCIGAVMGSDAFFPFDDIVTLASKYKISSIIQPGGSIRDQDSINAVNKENMSMIFTGMRHFKH